MTKQHSTVYNCTAYAHTESAKQSKQVCKFYHFNSGRTPLDHTMLKFTLHKYKIRPSATFVLTFSRIAHFFRTLTSSEIV